MATVLCVSPRRRRASSSTSSCFAPPFTAGPARANAHTHTHTLCTLARRTNVPSRATTPAHRCIVIPERGEGAGRDSPDVHVRIQLSVGPRNLRAGALKISLVPYHSSIVPILPSVIIHHSLLPRPPARSAPFPLSLSLASPSHSIPYGLPIPSPPPPLPLPSPPFSICPLSPQEPPPLTPPPFPSRTQ